MKVTVITVCFNSAATLADTLRSVASQSHPDIEHIVIDGGSTDGTVSIVEKERDRISQFVSEPDDGIYDAMNKGLRLATGEIIGFLNSDDVYENAHVIRSIVREFAAPGLEAVFADAVFVDADRPASVLRRYSSRHFGPKTIAWGWMPAHPTLFLRRSVYERHGGFKTGYRIAGDFEFIARTFSRNEIRYRYLPEVFVRMRNGGVSTSGLKGTLLLNREVLRACRENGLKTNVVKVGSKYLFKMLEFIPRHSTRASAGRALREDRKR